MARPKTIDGNKYLKIRVSSKFYRFIDKKSQMLGVSTAEFCRSALEIVAMGMFLGKNVKIGEIEQEFMKRYGRRIKTK